MSVNKVNSDGSLSRVAGGTLYADAPVGSWIKWDGENLPSGFLKAGDTISQTLYPELYAKYGSAVPYKADTSELGDIETVTLPMTVPYDGELIPVASNGGYITFSINDNQYTVGSSAGMTSTSGLPIKKGDVLALQALVGTAGFTVRYYKKSLIVKAKQVAVPADFMDAIDKSKPIEVTATLDFNAYGNALVTPPNGYKVISAIMPDHNWAFDVFYDNNLPYVHSRGLTDYSAKITGSATIQLVYIKI